MVHRLLITKRIRLGFIALLFCLVALAQFGLARADIPAQIPTGSIPTVTGTPVGALAIVLANDQGFINVRAGPSTVAYDIVGVLVEGSQVPAIGRSPGGDWIEVAYPGIPGGVAWIWSDLVEVRGSLPVIEPPPTQTPRVTATIDPTLAAQFLVEVPPTRLPTFTEPPPLSKPTIPVDAPIASQGRLPVGLIITGLAVIGLFGTVISFLRSR
jgi:hypothetical protein